LNARDPLRVWARCKATSTRLGRDDHGAQILEFAIALPLLVLFVVGIFDFSNAFTLKQKLTNVARDAARAAAADPSNDLSSPQTAVPISVSDTLQIVDNYLVANHLSECGLSGAAGTPSGLTWTYTATTGCPGGGSLILTVNRGYYFPATTTGQPPTVDCVPQASGPSQTAVISTCVSIQYPYQWRFGRVASVLGSTGTLPMQISATAIAMNEN
jgi:Flp pilus assembly protein TadG